MSTKPDPAHQVLIAALIAVCVAASSPSTSCAGSICGTVRDAATSAVVAHAGVFARTPAGAYTGLNAATDDAGSFCINNVPAGTYDLEVLVDDYRVGYLRGVQVTTSTDVQAEVSLGAASLAAPYPNPARGSVRLAWRLGRPGSVRLAVFDAHGRLVAGWQDAAA